MFNIIYQMGLYVFETREKVCLRKSNNLSVNQKRVSEDCPGFAGQVIEKESGTIKLIPSLTSYWVCQLASDYYFDANIVFFYNFVSPYFIPIPEGF